MAETTVSRRFTWALIMAGIVAVLLPMLAYWWVLGRVPTMNAVGAREQLAAEESDAVLVDIRPAEEYEDGRITSSVSWPWREIAAVRSEDDIPAELRGKRLILICESGIASALAARHLMAYHSSPAYSLRDGMCGWIAPAIGVSKDPDGSYAFEGSAKNGLFETRSIPVWEQWASVLSSFVVKPIYMLLSLVLIVWLRRAKSADLKAFRWGMIAFLFGEGTCALNYVFIGKSYLLEYLHMAGMMVGFALVAWAVMEGLDSRLLHLSDPNRRCAAIELCGTCVKHNKATCGLQRVFLFIIPAVMLVATISLFAYPKIICYNTSFLGTPFNCNHNVLYQIYEIRFCPVYALVSMALSFGVLLSGGWRAIGRAKYLLAAGLGAMSFGFFRFLLFKAFAEDLVWMAFWEEATEMIFIAGALCVIWIFRGRLLPNAEEASTRAPQQMLRPD